ncbi:DinB family protein [Longimicrobium terrae]|uniref:Putative damage-inducible protein DinB n=1 Tax=Longimicrobium terrae TaxID=1639882 RepID=A0A841H457_9BACT|nr:DinB family protein [Longimicrobium terrae]MBB4638353.1 putative damage-inducible protein DinB [Longimicrobium terrae]MBB6072579.1 putative damage-inducible protein DinB [Longimicrobium terrae]NNC28642.1 DUF1572 family protein [Longimicrobium terrae]
MTDTSTASSVARIAFPDLEQELATTRRVLERVPDEHLDWKPHEKSFALGGLAAHLANLLNWTTTVLTQDELDLATQGRQELPRTRDDILALFDGAAARLRPALAAATDDTLNGTWTLRMGDHVIMQMPRASVIRTVALNHMVHHRAQLGVYMRLLDIPVPAMYGPSADEAGPL